MGNPWESEPDELAWTDEGTGYDCFIRRNGTGALCGYVRVPSYHPAHGVDYDSVDVDVHGGLTFAGDRGHNGRWWLGFDCAHAGDFTPRVHLFEVGETMYRDINYVKRECEALARQLRDMVPVLMDMGVEDEDSKRH